MGIISDTKKFDPNMVRVFLPYAVRHPRYIKGFLSLYRAYKKSKKIRVNHLKTQAMVPPFMILSVTKHCNLTCAGCYAAGIGTLENKENTKSTKPQLNTEEWKEVISEANDLGVFAYVIAGGEPFLLAGLLDLCKTFKNNLFLIFTNGTAIKKEHYFVLKKLTNVAVIVSIEGSESITNKRRGSGVYQKVISTLKELNRIGIINGISVTINKMNYRYWMDDKVIDKITNDGIRIGFFLEYIPMEKCDNSFLMMGENDRKEFRSKVLEYRENKKIYLIHSPGDEKIAGGCVSAGKGFAHITPSGDLTPCPVSNISTHNVKNSGLKEGLESPLFAYIRENEHLLETEGVPCALYAHKEDLKEIMDATGAYSV